MKLYVDGFVIVMPKKSVKAYKKMAELGGKVWMAHGALHFVESIGEDLKGMPGCGSFTKLTKLKPSETVAFSWIMFKSKKHRDQVNAKVMKDPRMNMDALTMKEMPFDPKRMAYGGFETIVTK